MRSSTSRSQVNAWPVCRCIVGPSTANTDTCGSDNTEHIPFITDVGRTIRFCPTADQPNNLNYNAGRSYPGPDPPPATAHGNCVLQLQPERFRVCSSLAGHLKAAGLNVWLDQLDIVPGQQWDRAIETSTSSRHFHCAAFAFSDCLCACLAGGKDSSVRTTRAINQGHEEVKLGLSCLRHYITCRVVIRSRRKIHSYVPHPRKPAIRFVDDSWIR